jgi:Tol biopolymer transport system component
MRHLFVLLIIYGVLGRTGICQENRSFISSATKLPIQPTRTLSFTTDEGSYINVDVSPDGKTLVFDLLGDLYVVPASGGKATQLTRGVALNLRPVWSHDGSYIAYVSDISGSFHLNVRDLEGKFHRVLGKEDSQLDDVEMTSPVWLPDSRCISMDATYHRTGDHSKVYSLVGEILIIDSAFKHPLFFSRDGKVGYYLDADTIFQFDHNSSVQRKWTILPENQTSIAISPNGRWFAYIRDVDTGKNLIIRDVATNTDRVLVHQMSKFPYDFKPGIAPQHFSFSPDSRYIYISFWGKIHRVDVETGEDVIIDFEADVKVDLGPLNYNTYPLTHDSVQIKCIRSTTVSPDNKQILFSALNKIYVIDLPNGVPRLLVAQRCNQFQPVYSPDGKWIAYVSWSDTEGGFLWKVRTRGGRPRQLSKLPGQYYSPVWSPDGKQIAVIVGNPILGSKTDYGIGKIKIFSPENGSCIKVVDEEVEIANKLSYSSDGTALIYQRSYTSSDLLVSKKIENGFVKILLTGDPSNETQAMQARSISPDNKYIVFSASEDLYLAPRFELGVSQKIYEHGKRLLAIRFANGVDPHWESGGKKLCWTYGNRFFRIDPDKVIQAAERELHAQDRAHFDFNSLAVIVPPDESIEIKLKVPAAYGHGTIAITNARIITMKGTEVIEKGSLLIHNGRISSVGHIKNLKIPKGIKVVDVNGSTIIPGLIDLHLHLNTSSGIIAQQSWMYLASLAYGVTTASDPSQFYGTFTYSELLATGKMNGPRLFGAGQAVRPDKLIRMNSLNDARLLVDKRHDLDGILVKQYMLRTRLQRQWLLMASKEAGINMTNEGGFNPILHVGMIKDGSTGIEHNSPLGDVYRDIVMLRAMSGTYWDPTLQVYVGEKFHAQDYMNWKFWRNHIDKKLAHFLPSAELERIKLSAPEDSTAPYFITPAKIDALVRHQGGRVVLGSHGNDKGIGPHNELWALQAGGLTNMEALQAATIAGAEALGIQQDVGSLEGGKIADLIILNKNPLEDIHNSREIKYVMKDGILYDGNTLQEIWPQKKKAPEWQFKGKLQDQN